MKRLITITFTIFFLCSYLSSYASAATYTADMENTEWMTEPSVFGCKFRQPIPYYGFANFFKEAGEDVIFYLETSYNLMKDGEAALVVEAPGWLSNALTSDLGYVPVIDHKYPVKVESYRSMRMMAELEGGMAPTFTRTAKYDSDQIRVRLSPVNFKQYMGDYLACVSGLLPVNYNQVKQSSLLFDIGQDGLSAENRRQLEMIAVYVAADSKITGIFIDGHTDNVGTRYHNRRLSEKRSGLAADYLIGAGVDSDMMITRYHGERYPSFTNNTSVGRAKNRRVTIRIDRIFGDDDDPLAKHPVFLGEENIRRSESAALFQEDFAQEDLLQEDLNEDFIDTLPEDAVIF